jgi:pyridinium-3,5-bisthiocarboxylic acid mononucleotide nickel chelatase
METNIDDMNPQIYDYVMELLLKQGALDVWLTPIHMKKNRPAITLSVLALAASAPELSAIIMKETTTLGIRINNVSRHVADRTAINFESSYGTVSVKVKRFNNEILNIAPEYDQCRKIAREKNISLMEVYRTIQSEATTLTL